LKNLDSKINNEIRNKNKKEQILDDRRSQRSQSAYSNYSKKSAVLSQKSKGGLS